VAKITKTFTVDNLGRNCHEKYSNFQKKKFTWHLIEVYKLEFICKQLLASCSANVNTHSCLAKGYLWHFAVRTGVSTLVNNCWHRIGNTLEPSTGWIFCLLLPLTCKTLTCPSPTGIWRISTIPTHPTCPPIPHLSCTVSVPNLHLSLCVWTPLKTLHCISSLAAIYSVVHFTANRRHLKSL